MSPNRNLSKILAPSFENISFIAEALHRSEVVGVPTETVYGLAGDCHSPLALARIFDSKERPTFDPLIVHVGIGKKRLEDLDAQGVVDAQAMTPEQREIFDRLVEKFWPGPLTLILPKNKYLPELVTSGLSTVGVRMPRHPVMLSLLARFGKPLAAPSANRFGHISPTSAAAVAAELGNRIDLILDGGECEVGLESTILNLSKPGEVEILRYGGTPVEDLSAVLSEFRIPFRSGVALPGEPEGPKSAPGMLLRHYSPDTPFFILETPLEAHSLKWSQTLKSTYEKLSRTDRRPIGILLLKGDPRAAQDKIQEILVDIPFVVRSLSPSGDLKEMAHGLFSTLRELDSLGLEAIFSEPCLENRGLGFAIADRLRRASAR